MRPSRWTGLLVAVVAVLTLPACYTTTTSEPVTGALTRGSGLSFKNEITVVFQGVSQDSRCPQGVECVRAGEAYAQFTFTPNDGQPADATIVFGAGWESWSSYAGYLVTLTALDPDPPPQHAAGELIDYTAHIRIEESDE